MENVEKITVVLLSWKRPKNIPIILSSLYRSKNIEEIILWNNNQRIQLKYKNKKLLIINSPKNFGTLARWCITMQAKNKNILFLDDDLVLSPKQIQILFDSYLNNPNRIYGCFGRNLENNKYVFKPAFGDVDIILGRVMLFDKNYLHNFFKWISGKIGNVEDDILFSFTFKNKHRVVNVGEIKELPDPYPLWKRNNHLELRQEMVDFCLKEIIHNNK